MPAEAPQEITPDRNRHERRVAAAVERRGGVVIAERDNVTFVIFPELKSRYGIPWSRMHVDRLEKRGAFPRRVQLGPNSVAWLESEILAWLAEQIAARDRKAA